VLLIPIVALSYVVPGETTAFLAQLVASLLYYALMHSSESQATWGKRVFGIKVTGLEGERIGFRHAARRFVASWVSIILLWFDTLIAGLGLPIAGFTLLCIGLPIAGFTPRKQALHDMICGTLVVNREASPGQVAAGGGTMPMTRGVWAMAVVLLLLPCFLWLLGLMGMH
jgi:uncharacterized RDD family membrane protein YckC